MVHPSPRHTVPAFHHAKGADNGMLRPVDLALHSDFERSLGPLHVGKGPKHLVIIKCVKFRAAIAADLHDDTAPAQDVQARSAGGALDCLGAVQSRHAARSTRISNGSCQWPIYQPRPPSQNSPDNRRMSSAVQLKKVYLSPTMGTSSNEPRRAIHSASSNSVTVNRV